ncbi:hypothetical protein [Chryseobacterium takakiae]|uniref:LURP-one-related n=1 Tax=Chryseobacterium takakiae TaxID=1302685 RepID=A0A1M4XFY5_9FLAO|nr:hypothetical protein [Chryseobacterium takakiae]SHE92253.1 hypothetical protein SAMN05444408_10637 [Chryseobacterium takakiae]
MKIYTINKTKASYQLFDDHEILVGEIVFDYILRRNIKIKTDHQLFTLKRSGFAGNTWKFLDEKGKLAVMIDSSNRMFYYGHPYTDIYAIKIKGRWNSATYLLNHRDDSLLMSMQYRNLFFTRKYHLEVEDHFPHALVMLAFLCYNIEIIEN